MGKGEESGPDPSQVLISEPDFPAPELWPLGERARERADFESREGLPRMTRVTYARTRNPELTYGD